MRTRGVPDWPVWWPDGKRVVYTDYSLGSTREFVSVRQLVESAGERDTLVTGVTVSGFSPDTTIAVGTKGFGGGAWIVPLSNGKGEDPISLDSFPTEAPWRWEWPSQPFRWGCHN